MREFEVCVTSLSGETKEYIVNAENLRQAKAKIQELKQAKFFEDSDEFEFKEAVWEK